MKRIIFGAVLAAAVIVSCNKPADEDWWEGMEHITYSVEGKVTDSSGNPLAGISVATDHCDDVVFTDAGGAYEVTGLCVPVKSVRVDFVDKDKEENGGSYMSVSVNADLTQISEGKMPYVGQFAAYGVDVVMIPKTEEILPPDVPVEVQ